MYGGMKSNTRGNVGVANYPAGTENDNYSQYGGGGNSSQQQNMYNH